MGQFPNQVALRETRTRKPFCGGSVISDRFILTAAHCVVNLTRVYAVVGSICSNGRGGTTYTVRNIVTHKDFYQGDTFLNDIALLKTIEKIKFSDYAKPIPINYEFVGKNQTSLVAGFGFIDNKRTRPVKLQYHKWKTMSNSKCIKAGWGHRIYPLHLCLGGMPGISACRGDSGGAVAVNGSLVGIVSFGPENCGTGYSDINTRISEFREWIEDNMEI